MENLTLKNVQIFDGVQLKKGADLFIQEGKIVSKPESQAPVIEGENLLVFPGLVDPHVHVRDFDLAYKEDFETAGLAAACGGFVYYLDMPNSQPPVISLEVLEKRKAALKKSPTPCRLYFGTSAGDNVTDIQKAIQDPAVAAVKIYLNHTTGDLLIEDEKLLNQIFAVAPLIAVHAEEEMVERALKLAVKHQTKLYLCHISRKDELEIAKKYKEKYPSQVFIEVTPHHLFLTEKDIPKESGKRPASFYQMRPPLRSKEDQEALWQGMAEGIVDTIGTDHAPHTEEEKRSDNSPNGVPGLETVTPLMFNSWRNKMVSIEQIFALMSKNPAGVFNLNYQPGIREGESANLVVIDLENQKEVRGTDFKSKCHWTPFEDWELTGWPVLTLAQGKATFKNI